MKKTVLSLIFILFIQFLFGQITVNTTGTTSQLVLNNLLVNNGVSLCPGFVPNITSRDASTYGLPKSIGSFTYTGPAIDFPLSKGIVLSTGFANRLPGPNGLIELSDGTNSWLGDNQLLSYIQSFVPPINPGATIYRNATVLEFDFIALTDKLSFDYVFLSEEYGKFQCEYADAFAFFLNDVTAGTPPQNTRSEERRVGKEC